MNRFAYCFLQGRGPLVSKDPTTMHWCEVALAYYLPVNRLRYFGRGDTKQHSYLLVKEALPLISLGNRIKDLDKDEGIQVRRSSSRSNYLGASSKTDRTRRVTSARTMIPDTQLLSMSYPNSA